MSLFLNQYRVESSRLPGWSYASPGYYFLTTICYQRQCLFGALDNGNMVLNNWGQIVQSEWLQSGTMRQEICLDVFVVMPNHFHAVVE